MFKNFAASNYCISEINKTQVNNAQDMMPIYNSIEYSNVYLKISGSLQYYHRDGKATEMIQLQTITKTLLIFLLIAKIVFRSNLNSKQQDKQEMEAQNILK